MQIIAMNDLDLSNKRVLLREDLNVPLNEQGEITSAVRIEAALPTIQQLHEKGAALMIMSHLGRPQEGVAISEQPLMSLKPVAQYLQNALKLEVVLTDELTQLNQIQPGQVYLIENIRTRVGEKANDQALARQLASLCDVFIMDAFATAHRAQASTHGVAQFAPIAAAGPLLMAELTALEKALSEPKRPLLAIVGGAKVSSKLSVLEALAKKVDQLLPGGGIANTFLKAKGNPIGQSLHEPDLLDHARALLQQTDIVLPTDVRVAKAFNAQSKATVKPVTDVADDDLILDIGPETARHYAQLALDAGTILWNGPLGVFEFEHFRAGTETLAKAIAQSQAFSVAGGGDTLAAIDLFDQIHAIKSGISYISTGGGAFLEYVQGDILPAVEILQQRAVTHT